MAFTALTPAEVSPDQPVSTTLMDKIRGNFDDHEQRIAASSGIIGEVLNGSFETAQSGNPNWPDKWVIGQYSGGQVLLDTNTCHGKKSLKMIHSVSGGGGGYAESDYIAVSNLYWTPLNFAYYATAVGMSVEVWARCYSADANGNPAAYLGEYCIYRNTSANPQIWSAAQVNNIPINYDGTRYVKYRFVGGVSGSTVTGSVYLDAVGIPIRLIQKPLPGLINIPQAYVPINWPQAWYNVGSAFSVTIPSSSRFRWLVCQYEVSGSGGSDWYGPAYGWVQFYLNGVAGKYSTQPGGQCNGAWQLLTAVYDLTGVTPGTYTLQSRCMGGGPTENAQIAVRSQNLTHYFRTGFVSADATLMTYTDVYNSTPGW